MGRLLSKIKSKKEEVENPFSDKLLPDPLPYPYHQPEYTICLELTGLLVHSDWSVSYVHCFKKARCLISKCKHSKTFGVVTT